MPEIREESQNRTACVSQGERVQPFPSYYTSWFLSYFGCSLVWVPLEKQPDLQNASSYAASLAPHQVKGWAPHKNSVTLMFLWGYWGAQEPHGFFTELSEQTTHDWWIHRYIFSLANVEVACRGPAEHGHSWYRAAFTSCSCHPSCATQLGAGDWHKLAQTGTAGRAKKQRGESREIQRRPSAATPHYLDSTHAKKPQVLVFALYGSTSLLGAISSTHFHIKGLQGKSQHNSFNRKTGKWRPHQTAPKQQLFLYFRSRDLQTS